MITTDADFFQFALKHYDNTACTSAEEFERDMIQHQTIKRAIRRYIDDGVNLHRLVNHVLIFYNCFGKASTQMLLYKIQETEFLGVLVPIIVFLGWHDDSLDSLSLAINTRVIKELEEIFKS